MGLTRRELLRYGAAMGIGALLGYSLPRLNEIIYAVDKLANNKRKENYNSNS